MPQMQLPLFPKDVTYINNLIAFKNHEGTIYYFNGSMPIYSHDEKDVNAFKMFAAQLYINGNAKQIEIVKAFGVTSVSVKRWVKKYREEGFEGFFKRRAARTPHVLTPEVLTKAQNILDSGEELSSLSETLGIKLSTIKKAIREGKLHHPQKKTLIPSQVKVKGT